MNKLKDTKKCVIICDTLPSFLLFDEALQHFFPLVVICTLDWMSEIRTLSGEDTYICEWFAMSDMAITNVAQKANFAIVDGTMNATM